MIQEKENIVDEISLETNKNALALSAELQWFSDVLNLRLQYFFGKSTSEKGITNQSLPAPPELNNYPSIYTNFINYYGLVAEERLILMLALVPHIQPQILDVFFTVDSNTNRGHTQFGGIKGNKHSGFIPTIETALFLLAGNDLQSRFLAQKYFYPGHVFLAHHIIEIEQQQGFEPISSNAISIANEYADYFTSGQIRKPVFGTEFPAKQINTSLNWADLVLDDYTQKQLDVIRIWLKYGQQLLTENGVVKKIKPGFKALFHGPPGTGKTMTAALLGKLYNLEVYRVDLSMVVSKYIGETEKNLEKVFKKAETKNWILFFDEADALFGKRTSISDAHDKYANQEIAYLLQRLEDYPGLVILASNMRSNVDEAFTRRLQAIIYFPSPQPAERLRIWQNAFGKNFILPSNAMLDKVSKQYELAGGSIINVAQYAMLMALNSNSHQINPDDILEGIKKEYKKEGKTMS